MEIFAHKLKRAGVNVTLVIEPEQGHSLNETITRSQSMDYLERILKRPSLSNP